MNYPNNNTRLKESDYIRYLYIEGQRQGVHKSPIFYSELIKFVKSPEGRKGFETFRKLNPKIVGITPINYGYQFKRTFSR